MQPAERGGARQISAKGKPPRRGLSPVWVVTKQSAVTFAPPEYKAGNPKPLTVAPDAAAVFYQTTHRR